MIPYWLSRMQLLLGDEKVTQLMNSHVLVAGLGGVGGICAEMIARAGVGKMTIVDGDVVDLSNGNRQIPALHSTAGKLKAEVMAQRLQDINPALQLEIIPAYQEDTQMEALVTRHKFDYAVDCIDTLGPKVAFIKACVENGVPVVSSMGAGGKVDPSKAEIADISESHDCKLAKYVRKRLHEHGIYKGITVVFSAEEIDTDKVIVTEKAFPKKSLIGTISYMPAIFGCMVASVVIRNLYQQAGIAIEDAV
ncbi:tRNA A37 threonylcarbamoyladenosine dehydratase [Filimonas lacunae]|uniref:tRNA A37 threonylcarbamoyladenosine dehydratase n=1 Tax=Filimonas lacunae TaxID=477680 RepID=A0A173MB99_9BACT|nr:tRNA threonylcarbamoyladenosine dehydratase [Filimonas lacunae]BAV04802.1 molybdopterin biosynthesis protein MoeB [Filimonas lacunae]SIT34749.1 tRNA A37 threonylcarbamoyladenosine dehydratase [Filimonas lacunae]